MKASLKFMIILALVLGVFGQATTAPAAEKFSWKGPGAEAFFSSSDGCVLTEVSLFSRDETFKNPPGRPSEGSFVSLGIFQYDFCTDQLLTDASGFTWIGSSDLQVARRLAGATLNTTVSVYNWVSDTWHDVYIDLSWTATGPAVRQSSSFRSHAPDCKYHSRFRGSFRPADVTGSIWLDSTNLTPETGWGSVFDSQGSDQFIGCGF